MSGIRRSRSCTRLAAAALAATALAPLAGPAAAQDYPDKPLTMVVAFSAGGGTDTLARVMAGFLQEELGQPVTVENRPGGGALLAHQYFLQQPADGYTLLTTVAMPYLAVNTLVQGADFEVGDFTFINLPRQDYTLLAAAPDGTYESAQGVLDAIRDNPGEVTVGVGAPGSADYINLMLLLESLGLSEDDIRIVNYPGGNDLRLALGGGHVDVIFVSGQASLLQADMLQPLMVFREEPAAGWDAPAFAEVMSEVEATDPDFISGSLGGFAVQTEFRENYPERYEILVGAFEDIFNDPEKMQIIEERRLGVTEWDGPERSNEMVRSAGEALEKYQDMLVTD